MAATVREASPADFDFDWSILLFSSVCLRWFSSLAVVSCEETFMVKLMDSLVSDVEMDTWLDSSWCRCLSNGGLFRLYELARDFVAVDIVVAVIAVAVIAVAVTPSECLHSSLLFRRLFSAAMSVGKFLFLNECICIRSSSDVIEL